jgi:uroporphyrinogen-III synthase
MLIVTRPAAQAAPWLERLREAGVDHAVSLPLIGIAPLEDEAALAALRAQAQAVQRWRLVMFVSANAAEHFLAARTPGEPWPHGTWAACTGEGTRAALLAAGVPRQDIRAPAAAGAMDSEALWQQLRAHDWNDEPVLIVRGEDGRDWLADQLRARGARVELLAAYRRCLPRWSGEQLATLAAARAAPKRYLWLFSSSQAVRNLATLARAGADAWRECAAIATHERIGQAARGAGFGTVHVVPPTVAEVASAYRAWRFEQEPHLQSRAQ